MTDAHWETVYRERDPREVSWFEEDPARSFAWVSGVAHRASAVLDVGGGASRLVDRLVEAGYGDVTLLDVSANAVELVRARLGEAVHYVVGDVRTWVPERTYDVWHDRAVFHFFVEEADRRAYVDVLRRAVPVGGHAVIATFALDGPTSCSGLPTMRYDAASLVDALGPGFVLERSDAAGHRTPGGVVQPFTWVLVRRAD